MRNNCVKSTINIDLQIHTMTFKYGIEYRGIRYGWQNKELYKLPHVKNGRSYGMKIINPIRNGKVYNLCRTQKTIANLQLMTKEVNWSVEIIDSPFCPF